MFFGVDLRFYEALADKLEEVLKHSFIDKTWVYRAV
jgi:hypothetical protein